MTTGVMSPRGLVRGLDWAYDPFVASSANAPDRRRRGNIEWLPSGSARVKVYAGIDPVTSRENYLRELVRARRTQKETEREAEKVLTKLLNQVDERRSPRTSATVNQLLDRWLDVVGTRHRRRSCSTGVIRRGLPRLEARMTSFRLASFNRPR